MTAPASLLTLENVRFAYAGSAWALQVDALRLDPGECAGVVGPNGSGKSTLLRLAAGLLAPDAGAVLLDGQPLRAMRRRDIARRLGYLPQEAAALYDFTVSEVVDMGRYARQRGLGFAPAGDAPSVRRALAAVALSEQADRPLRLLSGGERRRALIAAVLAQEASAVLLDEPTSGLDPHHAAALFRLLRQQARAGLGVLIVTHDLNLAALFCDRILLLDAGRIVGDGVPREVLATDRLRALYGGDLLVMAHPQAPDRPVVLPAVGTAGGEEARR